MKEIMKRVYQLDIPLAGSPLREIHTYLIKGCVRNLLIDTAFNSAECETSLLEQMMELGAVPEQTDVFITHMHVDHSGLAAKLKRETNRIFASPKDAKLIDRFQSPEHWTWLTKNNCWSGVPAPDALNPEQHIAFSMRPERCVELTLLKEGEILEYGDYRLQVIDLAGHTPGQIGLWEPEHRMLFGGDHILERISPNITAWDMDHDYVGIFCDNLQKVKELKPDSMFSAHGPLIKTIEKRIDELLAHHQNRLDTIAAIVKEQQAAVTAYDVAIRIQWSSGKSFQNLPIQQKWFAASETMAHLLALTASGRIRMNWKGETGWFFAADSL